MRVTIIKDDATVGVDGVFRSVNLSGMPATQRAIQWLGDSGHVEYDESANTLLDNIEAIQPYIDLWTAAAPPAPPPPTALEMIAAAHARITLGYETELGIYIAGYPEEEIASWPKQEAEARAWGIDNNAYTPWINGAADARGIEKSLLVTLIIGNANALAPVHGALTGKRQRLRDEIDALGAEPTQEQLDAVQW